MKTRKQYMNKEISHREYYGQFVTPSVLQTVRSLIGEQKIKDSTDEYLNDIPLSRWDSMHNAMLHLCGKSLAEANGTGGVSLSDTVCVAKEAAKQIKESLEG